MDVVRVLRRLREDLDPRSVPLALAGAFALNAYGLGRATADLDLVAPRSGQDRIVHLLEGLGYETLHRSDGYSNHLHTDPVMGRVDFIYVQGSTASRLFDGARQVELPGVGPILVPHPEHLIAMKVHAIRNDPSRAFRDLADIQFLLERAEVDRSAVRTLFVEAGLEERWNELDR
jgi:hypothetical protein